MRRTVLPTGVGELKESDWDRGSGSIRVPSTHSIIGANAPLGQRMISAVVVTYNSAACVEACIASVQSMLPNADLVVVDNGSRDVTLRLVEAAAPHAW